MQRRSFLFFVLAFTFNIRCFCELPISAVWCLTLIQKNCQSLIFQIFPLFLSLLLLLLLFPSCICYPFCNCLSVLGSLFYFFFFFFLSLCSPSFWFLRIPLIIQLRDSFSICVHLLISPSFWLPCFLSLAFLFDSFLGFPILCFIALCAHMLSTLSFGALSILIIIQFPV